MIDATFAVADLDDLATTTAVTTKILAAEGDTDLNDLGSGAINVPFGETVTPSPVGRAVIVSFDGTPAHAFVGEVTQPVEVTVGEEARMTTEYSGRGLGSILDRYIVRPTLGYDVYPWAWTRTFSCFSPEYADWTTWDDAIELGPVGDPSLNYTGSPNGFPDFDVTWIQPVEADADSCPRGYWWTQDEFVLATDGFVKFFAAGDDAFVVYLDGFEIIRVDQQRNSTAGFRETHIATQYLTAGTHRIGAKVINNFGQNDPGYGEGANEFGNTSVFLLSGRYINPAGFLGDRVVETSASWKVIGFLDDPPGMTIPEIVEAIIDENVNDGILPVFTTSNTGTFPELETVTVTVGDSLAKLLADDWGGVYIDWHVPPTALDVQLWPLGERGDPSGTTFATSSNPALSNLRHLESARLDVGTDCLTVTWAGGHVRVPASGGERMGYVRTAASSIGEARKIGEAILARDPQPEQVTLAVAPLGTGDVPGVDFDNGDTLDAGSFTGERVVGWGFRFTDALAGEPEFSVALKDRIRGEEERIALMVRRASPGQLGGTAPAQPPLQPPDPADILRNGEIAFQPLYGADGESGEKRAPANGNMYAVAVYAKTAGTTDTDFEMLVDGVDALGGTGTLPATETFILLPVDPFGVVVASTTLLKVDITALGAGVADLRIEPRFV